MSALNTATMVVIMIETAEALEQVDDIAAVDGVDLLLIGTNDLCASLGIPGELRHDKVRAAYTRALEACRRRGKHLGVGGLNAHPDLAATFVIPRVSFQGVRNSGLEPRRRRRPCHRTTSY